MSKIKAEAILNNYQIGSYAYNALKNKVINKERIDEKHTKVTYDDLEQSEFNLLKRLVKNAKIVDSLPNYKFIKINDKKMKDKLDYDYWLAIGSNPAEQDGPEVDDSYIDELASKEVPENKDVSFNDYIELNIDKNIVKNIYNNITEDEFNYFNHCSKEDIANETDEDEKDDMIWEDVVNYMLYLFEDNIAPYLKKQYSLDIGEWDYLYLETIDKKISSVDFMAKAIEYIYDIKFDRCDDYTDIFINVHYLFKLNIVKLLSDAFDKLSLNKNVKEIYLNALGNNTFIPGSYFVSIDNPYSSDKYDDYYDYD